MNEISKKTNVTGIFFTLFMFIVIIAGYYVEVIRDNRTMGVILFLGASLLVIYGTAFALFKKDPETKKISYLLIFGFLIPYGYTLLTSVSVIAFAFIAPIFVISFMFFERKLVTILTVIVGVMDLCQYFGQKFRFLFISATLDNPNINARRYHPKAKKFKASYTYCLREAEL